MIVVFCVVFGVLNCRVSGFLGVVVFWGVVFGVVVVNMDVFSRVGMVN